MIEGKNIGKIEGFVTGIMVGTREPYGAIDGVNDGTNEGLKDVPLEPPTMYTAFDQLPPHFSPTVPVQGIVHTQLGVAPRQPAPHRPYCVSLVKELDAQHSPPYCIPKYR